MDIAGAVVLRQRLAQQENWRQARAMRVGSQPPFDPDGHALESFRSGVRYYRPRQRVEWRDGRHELVTRTLSKRLIDGAWEADVVVADVVVEGSQLVA
jgi:hypothetical protein